MYPPKAPNKQTSKPLDPPTTQSASQSPGEAAKLTIQSGTPPVHVSQCWRELGERGTREEKGRDGRKERKDRGHRRVKKEKRVYERGGVGSGEGERRLLGKGFKVEQKWS